MSDVRTGKRKRSQSGHPSVYDSAAQVQAQAQAQAQGARRMTVSKLRVATERNSRLRVGRIGRRGLETNHDTRQDPCHGPCQVAKCGEDMPVSSDVRSSVPRAGARFFQFLEAGLHYRSRPT